MNKTLDSLTLPAPTASVTDRLRYLIKLSRLTQAGFADRIGVDPSNLSRLLNCRRLRLYHRRVRRGVGRHAVACFRRPESRGRECRAETLHSDNPDYDDIELPRDAVRSLYLVETIMNFEIVI